MNYSERFFRAMGLCSLGVILLIIYNNFLNFPPDNLSTPTELMAFIASDAFRNHQLLQILQVLLMFLVFWGLIVKSHRISAGLATTAFGFVVVWIVFQLFVNLITMATVGGKWAVTYGRNAGAEPNERTMQIGESIREVEALLIGPGHFGVFMMGLASLLIGMALLRRDGLARLTGAIAALLGAFAVFNFLNIYLFGIFGLPLSPELFLAIMILFFGLAGWWMWSQPKVEEAA